ncbi:uncharacterized protein LOC109834649 [Asparagus officinalis]|uniref:uncharacterized protein LOC109834649 n=1 Tax=Asparagus officinalis TaxID=4686 RepID=UPI00098E7E21|nr:uncharacterized protein LOC109834649 [Asparagus officinalis]
MSAIIEPATGTDSHMTPGISQMPTDDGSTGPAVWADTLMTLGIPTASEDGGIAGPAVEPDTTTVPGAESLHRSSASPLLPSDMSNPPAGVDIPSSAAASEPVGSQPEGTSVGAGMLRTCLLTFLIVFDNPLSFYDCCL